MSHFDTIFLGSSPVQMMAHNKSCQNGTSLLIEQKSKLGGAWYTSELWGIKNMEMGCHILKNIPEGLRIMKENGVQLTEMQVPPTMFYNSYKGETFLNGLKLKFLWFRSLFSSSHLHERYFVNKLESGFKSSHITHYHYLPKGCFDLVQQLTPAPETFLTNQTINKVCCENGKVIVDLTNGEQHSCQRLFVPKNYKLEHLTINGQEILFEYDTYISEHYVLKFKDHLNHFSFIDVVGDDLINLISNVSLYTDYQEGTVLTIATKKPAAKTENNLEISGFDGYPTKEEQEKIVNRLIEKLKRFKIIPSKAQFEAFHYEPYLLDVKKNNRAYHLATLSNGQVISLDTSDLVESVINNPILNGHS